VKKNLNTAQQEFSKGNLAVAKKICLNLLEINKQPDIYNLLGVIAFSEKKFLKSYIYLNKCLKISKNHFKALNNAALILIEKKKYKKAIEFLNLSADINSQFTQTFINLSLAYLKLRNYNKSIYFLKKTLSIEKNNHFALNNLGNIYYEKRDYNKSINFYNKALSVFYENSFVHNNIGLLYERFNKFKKAKFHYQYALKIDPNYKDCQFNLSLLLLKIGKYKEGFELYVSRFFKIEKRIKLPFKVDLNLNLTKLKSLKKIFIVAEQGYGDIFQFCRFGLYFKKLKIKCCFVVYDELFQFMKSQNVFDEYIKISDFLSKKHSKDKIYPLMCLPRLFNIGINDLQPSSQYLFPNKTKTNHWKKKIDQKKFNIGIAWHSIKTPTSPERSIPYTYFYKLLDIPKINLISLHVPNQLEFDNKNLTNNHITTLNNLDINNKFEDTAALIANLDLVITIDTAIAHLSASMKKNTWVLLSYNSDWRWMLKIKKSLWYNSVTLFRSISYENWDSVFHNIILELKKIR